MQIYDFPFLSLLFMLVMIDEKPYRRPYLYIVYFMYQYLFIKYILSPLQNHHHNTMLKIHPYEHIF